MYFKVLYILLLLFTVLLLLVVLQPKFRNENKSPFKTHGGFFMIMSITTLFVSVLASGILLFTSYYFQSWMSDFHYTKLKNLGFLSALLAPFWLLVVLFIPHNLNTIVFDLVMFVIFLGINFAYCCLREYVCVHQQFDNKRTSSQDQQSSMSS